MVEKALRSVDEIYRNADRLSLYQMSPESLERMESALQERCNILEQQMRAAVRWSGRLKLTVADMIGLFEAALALLERRSDT